MVAAENGHLKIVEMLIASKANVNHQKNVSCLWLVYVHACSSPCNVMLMW